MALARDTIFALSSGRPPSGLAVVRLSGSMARFGIETIAGAAPPPRQLRRYILRHADGSEIDHAMVAWFPGPASYTGEDVAEFHCHGSKAVLAALYRTLSALPGTRLAEAGEFSRRAFVEGKLDLAQAEGIADLIEAETEAQRRFALEGLSGAATALYADWRRRIVEARALVEAILDFADEDDVAGADETYLGEIRRHLAALRGEMLTHVESAHRGEIIREGFRVVLAGAPNAGKSSLINALAQRDVAIVSDEPGTTRDVIDVALDLEGYKVIVSDMAGLRSDAGTVERIGIERAEARVASADLVLRLVDPEGDAVRLPATKAEVWTVRTKADRGADWPHASADLDISSRTGIGIEALLTRLASAARAATGTQGGVLPARWRHVDLIRQAADHLASALATEDSPEILAEEMRSASDKLGRIAGTVGVEDLLDVIFSRFCVGK